MIVVKLKFLKTQNYFLHLFICLFFISCKLTLITGYDELLDESATKIKSDFNLHFIKLNRTLHIIDEDNPQCSNFQNYYKRLKVDMINMKDLASNLPKSFAGETANGKLR